jgi:hypothetical protein
MNFDEISNYTQVVCNLKHYPSINLRIHLYFFMIFMNLFEIDCENCQNKYSLVDPKFFLIIKADII